jgi:hypothetical protein
MVQILNPALIAGIVNFTLLNANWASNQRIFRNQGTLLEEMRAILPKIGFVWKESNLFRDKSEQKTTANKSRDASYTDTSHQISQAILRQSWLSDYCVTDLHVAFTLSRLCVK